MPAAPTRRPTVLLLRETDADDPYEAALTDAGYEVAAEPVLAFEWVNADVLRAHLLRPHAYGGLVLTSPRAVEALADALRWLPSENERWHERPVYAVGPRTAHALRQIGFEAEGADSGSAALLGDFLARRAFDAPLLFLCGDRRRDELPRRLEEAGIPFEEACVYAAHLRTGLDFSAHAPPEWVVFFSPSGVEAIQTSRGLAVGQTRRAALGPTTAAALDDAGWPAEATADEPTPEGLVRALRGAG